MRARAQTFVDMRVYVLHVEHLCFYRVQADIPSNEVEQEEEHRKNQSER